jgi:5-formyltetrahydrofolate cyclo-ligase
MFLPATAVDMNGNRIGQGGGYYDKFLAAVDATGLRAPRAAIIYDAELLPASTIPAESFDRPVDAVLTPSGVIRLA